MQSKSDEQLINDYLKGDKKSLEILIKKYLKLIYSFAYWYVGNVEDAEDVTQEVFVKIWRNLKKFDPRRTSLRGRQKKRFKIWIFTIAKNTALDFLKKKKTIPFSAFENANGENMLAETLADPAPLPDKILERADIAKRLNSAMQQLSLKYQIVLFLRYNDHFTPHHSGAGFNFREIAESLRESLNTIKSRHRRAIILLKKLLTEP